MCRERDHNIEISISKLLQIRAFHIINPHQNHFQLFKLWVRAFYHADACSQECRIPMAYGSEPREAYSRGQQSLVACPVLAICCQSDCRYGGFDWEPVWEVRTTVRERDLEPFVASEGSRNLVLVVLVHSKIRPCEIDDLYFSSTCINSNGKQTERLETSRKMKSNDFGSHAGSHTYMNSLTLTRPARVEVCVLKKAHRDTSQGAFDSAIHASV